MPTGNSPKFPEAKSLFVTEEGSGHSERELDRLGCVGSCQETGGPDGRGDRQREVMIGTEERHPALPVSTACHCWNSPKIGALPSGLQC